MEEGRSYQKIPWKDRRLWKYLEEESSLIIITQRTLGGVISNVAHPRR